MLQNFTHLQNSIFALAPLLFFTLLFFIFFSIIVLTLVWIGAIVWGSGAEFRSCEGFLSVVLWFAVLGIYVAYASAPFSVGYNNGEADANIIVKYIIPQALISFGFLLPIVSRINSRREIFFSLQDNSVIIGAVVCVVFFLISGGYFREYTNARPLPDEVTIESSMGAEGT